MSLVLTPLISACLSVQFIHLGSKQQLGSILLWSWLFDHIALPAAPWKYLDSRDAEISWAPFAQPGYLTHYRPNYLTTDGPTGSALIISVHLMVMDRRRTWQAR
ncbi:hypothetical protein BDR05DRAFT_388819 [Suillus weaverae]|nr:hypothetical protein BDR05DRAFT_388819 [Suillus weaverae]